MTKVQVIEKLAQKLGVSVARAEQMVEVVGEVFAKILLDGGKIRLQGFGTFGTRTNPQRKTLNKKNKMWYVTDRNQGPYFKPSPRLKQLAQQAKPAVIESGSSTGKSLRTGKKPRPRLPAYCEPKLDDMFHGPGPEAIMAQLMGGCAPEEVSPIVSLSSPQSGGGRTPSLSELVNSARAQKAPTAERPVQAEAKPAGPAPARESLLERMVRKYPARSDKK